MDDLTNMSKDLPNYYDILAIEPSANRVDIREAYLRLKSTYGAGNAALYSLVSEDEARDTLARIEEAFRVLSDDIQRRDFDELMGIKRSGAWAGSQRTEYIDATQRQAERIGHLRARQEEEAARWDASPSPGSERLEPNVIRTTRSRLSVIQLKAANAGKPATLEAFAEIMASADQGDGDLYRRLREAAGVSENEMQERIKVSISYLRAIEGNHFDRLPQAVYVRGFLRSYFRYLTVPEPEALVEAFTARLSSWQAAKKN